MKDFIETMQLIYIELENTDLCITEEMLSNEEFEDRKLDVYTINQVEQLIAKYKTKRGL
jgi:hypothetical protein